VTEDNLEQSAQRIAQRGREALEERLRAAYKSAAATHSDILVLDDARIEAMAVKAVDNADGMQWRRALASVAADELGISETEALAHPAVVRAQEIAGAPSYEESIAALRRAAPAPPSPAPAPEAASAPPPGAPEVAPEVDESPEAEDDERPRAETDEPPEAAVDEPHEIESDERHEADAGADAGHEHDEEEPHLESDHEAYDNGAPPAPTHAVPAAAEIDEHAFAAEFDEDFDDDFETDLGDVDAAPPVTVDKLRVTAVHLGGVANLPSGYQGIDLRISSAGLDILRGEHEILGRLTWNEIDALEVPAPRGRRRRRGVARARLVVRTRQGDASFEIPAFSGDELRQRLDPLVTRFRRR
jgi:hypothetical protein